MAKPGKKGVARVIDAMHYSYSGLKAQWRHEAAFRQEFFLFLLALPLAFWLGDDRVERVLMVGSVFMVLIVETINSSIEAAIDRIGSERHELSGRAKDLGSAAVALALMLAAFVWLMLLLG